MYGYTPTQGKQTLQKRVFAASPESDSVPNCTLLPELGLIIHTLHRPLCTLHHSCVLFPASTAHRLGDWKWPGIRTTPAGLDLPSFKGNPHAESARRLGISAFHRANAGV